MLAYPISSVLLPKYYGQILDDIKNNKTLNFSMIIGLLILSNLMYIGLSKVDNQFIPKLQAYVRINIVKMVFDNYKDKFEEQELGILISKIVKLPIVIRDLMYHIRNYLVPLTMILPFIVIQFTMIDKYLGLIVIFGMVALYKITYGKIMECLNIASSMDSDNDLIHENISELFDNMLDIYSMNMHTDEVENLKQYQDDIASSYKDTYNCTNSLKIRMNTCVLGIFMSSIVYAYHLYTVQKINMIQMTNVSITAMYAINMLGSLSNEISAIIFDLGTYLDTQTYLDKISNKTQHVYKNFKITSGEISFRDIEIKYGDKKVLSNFNFLIKPKESIAIVGKIGAGKSSIVKALLKLIKYNGDIFIDGININDIDPCIIRSQILYVRQNPLPFNRSLYDNILYGNKNITKKDIDDLFVKYNLHNFFKHDLNKKVGKKGGYLSGGQRQLIFLLRVMLSSSPIIILDEPTSSLDDRSTKYVMQILSDILSTRTVIIITHDKKIEEITDRVLEMQ
jgi:ABC-type bacteriocin/lantibiotic exporter with double-glycine peptidase domain